VGGPGQLCGLPGDPSDRQAGDAAVARGGTRAIPLEQLRGIAVPTALLWGSRDRLLPLPIAQAASATLGWPLQVIDDAGHLPHVEQPTAFLDALVAATAEE
jgi:pimeloyl-ACP methyl ester carboxylesterase